MFYQIGGGSVLLKSCGRCGALIPYGGTYCRMCQEVVDKEKELRRQDSIKRSNRKYNKTRNPKYTRFYNSKDWCVLSQSYMQAKGYKCEQCGQMATEVHHIKPIQTDEGWNRRLDYDNLELLCKHCHNERHERFRRRRSHYKRF